MRLNNQILAILAGTAVTAALVVFHSVPTVAQTGQQVNEIARQVTVLILGKDQSMGSGVIISQDGNSYYVLTANHVLGNSEYQIVTLDKEEHSIEPQKIKRFSDDVDLAVVEFNSNNNYPVARLAKSDSITPGSPVFVSGWPKPGQIQTASKQIARHFSSGSISAILPESIKGYQIGYNNITVAGMSGGPVFDLGGRVVAIHGLADYDLQNAEMLQRSGMDSRTVAELTRNGFNYGIPINTFLRQRDDAGVSVALQLENQAPPQTTQPVEQKVEQDQDFSIDVGGIFANWAESILEGGLRRIPFPW
jgi:S1-C subfamily serine protease